MLQKVEHLKELPIYKKNQVESIDLRAKYSFLDFPVTSNVNFADDLWVFKEFKRFKGEEWAYKYEFNKLDPTYKNYAKYMVLRALFNKNNRFTTVKSKYYVIKSFIEYLTEHHIFVGNLIDISCIEGFLATTQSERSLSDKKNAIKLFLSEIELRVPGVHFLECYKYLNKIDSKKVKAEREKGKHKFIDVDTHNRIISLALRDLQNKNLCITQHSTSCMIVLLAETGMRLGEFRLLEVDRLEEISLKGETEVFYYLNFRTYKTVKEKDFKWTRSFITKNALIAYKTLSEIHSKKRTTNYLFINEEGTQVSKTSLRKYLIEFFYRHKSELQLDKIVDPEVRQFAVTRKRNFKGLTFIPDDEIDTDVYYVTFHQYRVVLATILYNKGYHLDFIRQHMNHLTDEMTKHYIRIEESQKLEMNAVETLMRRSSRDGSTLNTDNNESNDKYIQEELQSQQYQEVYKQINDFLKKNKLNIFNDINQIINKLSRNDTAIGDMELGVCAKSFNKLCERNQYISSINDAYYIGIQINSLDDLPYSIKCFQEKSMIIEYNEKLYKKNPKYRNEFERELKGIKKYIERKLNPEIMLLKDEINKIGHEEVYNKHPELEEIIRNISCIEMEIKRWKEKTL